MNNKYDDESDYYKEDGRDQNEKAGWTGSPGGSYSSYNRLNKPLPGIRGAIIESAARITGPSGNPLQGTPRNIHTVASMGGRSGIRQNPLGLHKDEGENMVDDDSDYYMIDEDGKMVIMPTEELFDDGSDDDNDDENEKKQVDDEMSLPSWLRPGYKRPAPGSVNIPKVTAPVRSSQMPSTGAGSARAARPTIRFGSGAGRVRPTIRFGQGSTGAGRSGVRMQPGKLNKSANQPLRDPKGGLTAAGRKHFKETEGANLKPGVKGPADTPTKMRRKGSFLVRFFTNPRGPMVDEKGRPTRLALSARAWGEPVPQNREDAAKLAAKGRRLLDRYRAQQERAKGEKSFQQFDMSLKQLRKPLGNNDGMIKPGNIDVSKRPAVKLPGGDYGTVRSMGINDGGKEVLIPTIGPRGENWSGPKGEQRAVDHYRRTGQHLGKFNSVSASNNYAQRLHQNEALRLNKPKKAYNTTSGSMDSRERASAAEGRDVNSNLNRPNRRPGWNGTKTYYDDQYIGDNGEHKRISGSPDTVEARNNVGLRNAGGYFSGRAKPFGSADTTEARGRNRINQFGNVIARSAGPRIPGPVGEDRRASLRPNRGPGWGGTAPRPRSAGGLPKPTYRVTPSIDGRRQPASGQVSRTMRGNRDSLGRNVKPEQSWTGSPGGNAPRTPKAGKYYMQPALGKLFN